MPEKRRLAEVVEFLAERRTRARIQSQQREAGLVPDDEEDYGSDASYESTIDYSEEDAAFYTSQVPHTMPLALPRTLSHTQIRPSFVLPPTQTERSSQLQAKLSSFLSQMEESNEELGRGESSKNIEDVDEDEQHIVLELGLGVLEEREKNKAEDNGEGPSNTADKDEADDTPTGLAQQPDELLGASMEAQPDTGDSSHMDTLLGIQRIPKKATIKEVA